MKATAAAHSRKRALDSTKASANRKRVPRQHTLAPSRWGDNLDETIGNKSLDYLKKRYGLTISYPNNDEAPAFCSCTLSRINFKKDVLSAMEVAKYLDNMFAEGWNSRRLKRLKRVDDMFDAAIRYHLASPVRNRRRAVHKVVAV
jgi:hypothetical protein